MKKLLTVAFIIACTQPFAAGITEEMWEHKPMVEGNRRVDELREWSRLHPGEMAPLTDEEKYKLFTSRGYPLPHSGVKVMPLAEIKMPPERSAIVKKYIAQQRKFGLHEEFSRNAKSLLSMPELAKKDLKRNKGIELAAEETNLRKSHIDLEIGYKYSPLNDSFVQKLIGFAPEHVQTEKGWTGVVEFFVPNLYNESVCGFHEINIAITGTSAIIPKEIVSYKINGKMTNMDINGNKDSGYIYRIEWWDKNFKHNLDCASKVYSSEMKEEVIGLAKAIDFSRS